MAYSTTPLTDEEVLEHALRAVARDGSGAGMADTAHRLRSFNPSVLDLRAAAVLDRIEAEENA